MMKRRTAGWLLCLYALTATGASTSAQTANPYAGEERRVVKALSAKEVDALVQGRGMGLAKSAELNHYPGPSHSLDLAQDLNLTAEQRRGLEASMARMSAKAKQVGAEILALEGELDAAFARRTVNPAKLAELTARIGAGQGTLRRVHLEAHLETAALLTPEQIARYDALRGYSGIKAPSKHGGHAVKH